MPPQRPDAPKQWPNAQGEVVAGECTSDNGGLKSAEWLMEPAPFLGNEASLVAALEGSLLQQHFDNTLKIRTVIH